MKTSNQVREQFLSYFERLKHTRVASSSLVPHNDDTLLFTNAGMNQFKELFLGLETRPYSRACTSQKCVRAGGKHNDLEQVGFTPRHHTFFEMLGNFSFGDYFKEEAIQYAWDFITKDMGISKSRLYVSVYHQDEQAFDIWKKKIGIPESRIYKFGDEDNFWAMGETGPCGPCSEIFVDMGPKALSIPNKKAVGGDEGRFVEIWNNVFMQFERDEKGKLTKLPKPSIDTGMGLERMCSVIQGVTSNFHTDLFKEVIDHMAELSKYRYGADPKTDISLNVVADHLRAMTFLINDGIIPGNEGRSYVLRRIMRRAIRHNKLLGHNQPILKNLVPVLVDKMKDAYPDLVQNQAMIESVILSEEEKFVQTLSRGLELLEGFLKPSTTLNGEVIFKLYDTYGFPPDLTKTICMEHKMQVDETGFDLLMKEQKSRAQSSWKGKFKAQDGVFYDIQSKVNGTMFVGYEKTSVKSDLLYIIKDGQIYSDPKLSPGEYQVILKETPFYAQGGGQVGDRGKITFLKGAIAPVLDTQKVLDTIFVHKIQVNSPIESSFSVHLEVDKSIRQNTACNHTATHLLHHALRTVLGNHVRQAGSLVNDEILRFDFTHFEAVTPDQIDHIEKIVNSLIMDGINLRVDIMDRDEAVKTGAMALFGEKYTDKVRVISAGPSVELCGGTHVRNTSEIRLFCITSEGSSSSGVRRIEAKAGQAAVDYLKQQQIEFQKIQHLLNTKEPIDRIKSMLTDLKNLEKAKPLDKKILFETADVLAIQTEDQKRMRDIYDEMKGTKAHALVIFSENKGRLSILIGQSNTQKLDAKALLDHLAKEFGLTGGGKTNLAQGGSTDATVLDSVLSHLKKLNINDFFQ